MYVETTWARTATIVLCVVGVTGLAVMFLVPGDVAALGLIAATLGFVGAGATFGIQRYSSVAVSPTHLVVGRDRIELSRLDRAYGVQSDSVLPDHVRARLVHIAFSGQSTAKSWREALAADGGPGRLLAIPSRHPDRTTAALRAALG